MTKLETVNPEVFGGDEYCCCDPTDKFYDECDHFDPEREKCWLFSKDLKQDGRDIYLKCQECKDHYKKNKYPKPPDPPPKRKICEDVFSKDHYQMDKQ